MRNLRPYTEYSDEKLVVGYERLENRLTDLMLSDADETLIRNTQWTVFHLGAEMDVRGIDRRPYDWEETL